MSSLPNPPAASRLGRATSLRQRRIRRLKREIELLSAMDEGLWRRALLSAVGVIGGLALLFVLVAWKLQFFGAGALVAILVAVGLAALCWVLGRNLIWLPIILAGLALAILLEDVPDLGDFGDHSDGGKDRKAERRAKIARAIDKRRLLLARLEAKP